MQRPILAGSLVLVSVLSTGPAQHQTTASVDVDGGTVEIHYTPTKLKGRSADDIPVGSVWRMSAGAAAELQTSVPLAKRGVVIAPGRHRISAKRTGKSTWQLVLFQGATLFRDGMTHQTASLRMDDEEESAENLKFTVKKSRGAVRIKLLWGKHSLNARLDVMGSKKIEATAGGKPATFHFYNIPVSKNQTKLTNGEQLTIGQIVQKGDHPIVYTMHAQKKGSTGIEMILKNASIQSAKKTLDAALDQKKRIAAFIEKNPNDDRIDRAKEMLQRIDKQITSATELHRAASALSGRVAIDGSTEDIRRGSSVMEVSSKKGEDGLVIEITFGRKVATFVVKEGVFKKQ